MKNLSSTLVAFLGICCSIVAQELQQPLEEVPFSNRGYALLKTGEVIEGRIRTTNSSRGITKVKLEDEFGVAHTINADEIFEFAIAMNDAVRLQYTMEAGSSVKKMLSKDQPTTKPSDFLIFRNTSIDGEKELLLQLLNPDLDDVIEVFYDPFARKTTAVGGEYITWTGDKHRAYFASKNGGPLLKVKKGNYDQTFALLFGDCPQLSQIKKPKLEDLGQHIFLYSSYCSFHPKEL